jgi:hypothetical protein
MPRAASPVRNADSSRTVSSRRAHRCPTSSLLWSSRNANRIALRPPTGGPCSASPVHRTFGASASNRPNARGAAPSGRVVSSRRTKSRCRVRSVGAHPRCARRIAATCTAVRSGTSFFTATARSSTSAGVRGDTRRGVGTSASNPPRRQSRIHRSSVARDARTGVPNGPGCSRAASARTSRPRCLVESRGSAASRIRPYRNNPTARARSARI